MLLHLRRERPRALYTGSSPPDYFSTAKTGAQTQKFVGTQQLYADGDVRDFAVASCFGVRRAMKNPVTNERTKTRRTSATSHCRDPIVLKLPGPPRSLAQTEISRFSANSPELAAIRERILSLQSAY
jgi:hypothetical protein